MRSDTKTCSPACRKALSRGVERSKQPKPEKPVPVHPQYPMLKGGWPDDPQPHPDDVWETERSSVTDEVSKLR